MRRKSKLVTFLDEERQHLEDGCRTSEHHSLRQRCKMILLKADGHAPKEVAGILSANEISVHNWRKRYASDGMKGLKARAGKESVTKNIMTARQNSFNCWNNAVIQVRSICIMAMRPKSQKKDTCLTDGSSEMRTAGIE